MWSKMAAMWIRSITSPCKTLGQRFCSGTQGMCMLSLGLAETKGLQKSASWWHYNSRSSQHFFFFTLIFHRPAGRKCSRTILVMHFVQQQFHGPPAVPPDPLGVVDPLLRTWVSHQILGPGYKDSGGCYLWLLNRLSPYAPPPFSTFVFDVMLFRLLKLILS